MFPSKMKRIDTLLILLIFIFLYSNSEGQSTPPKEKDSVYAEEDLYEDDPYYWSYTKEIGINFTPLLSKFVPFNLGQNDAGLIGLKYKKYYSKRAFRINLGANISDDVVRDGNPFVYIGFGIETRYPITKDKKLSYTSAYDLFLSAEGEDGEPIFGFSKGYGFEYHLGKRVFLSTEAAFQIGRTIGEFGEGIVFNFQLPTAIFVNVRLY